MSDNSGVKKFTTIDDIDRRRKEEAKNKFARDITGTLRSLLNDAKKNMEKRRDELKKKRPLWKKIMNNLIWIMLIILFFDIFLGSIWLLIKLSKYFIGFI